MMTATYDPADNKLRLYSPTRLDKETYDRVRANGFIYAPKQELFVAPMWTPQREDLLLEICDGVIGDEDTSLVERAEQRAERFEDYSDKRSEEAGQAKKAVDAIADNIPLGQPILIAHHSERHARRDAEKIQNGMRRAISLFDTSQYWKDRAAGAIKAAKYKERPDVRYRRIKGLEADKRKQLKIKDDAERMLKLWLNDGNDLTMEQAQAIANFDHGSYKFPLAQYPRELPCSQYEGDMGLWSALDGGVITPKQAAELAIPSKQRVIAWAERWISHLENRIAYERAMLDDAGGSPADKFDIQVGGRVLVRSEWLTVLKVNKAEGVINSVTTNSRYVPIKGIEEVKDYQSPDKETAEKVKAATKLPPMCNYPGDGIFEITNEQWKQKHPDQKGSRIVEATETNGRHRVRVGRFAPAKEGSIFKSSCQVYIVNEKRKDPPTIDKKTAETIPGRVAIPAPEASDPATELRRLWTSQGVSEQRENELIADINAKAQPGAMVGPFKIPGKDETNEFEAMKETLKKGVQIVVADQLFPTPPEIAARMVEVAGLMAGCRILEPSAGTGNIIRAIINNATGFDTCRIVAVEINPSLVGRLKEMRNKFLYANESNFEIHLADFLTCNGSLGFFDRILLNPPYHNATDIRHILHAQSMLKLEGRLVALCANGPRQQEALRDDADLWEILPEGSFKQQGTNVNVALVVLTAKQPSLF